MFSLSKSQFGGAISGMTGSNAGKGFGAGTAGNNDMRLGYGQMNNSMKMGYGQENLRQMRKNIGSSTTPNGMMQLPGVQKLPFNQKPGGGNPFGKNNPSYKTLPYKSGSSTGKMLPL